MKIENNIISIFYSDLIKSRREQLSEFLGENLMKHYEKDPIVMLMKTDPTESQSSVTNEDNDVAYEEGAFV